MSRKSKKFDLSFDQKSLVYRFRQQILAKNLLKDSGTYLIGCSGGADSVALFHLMRLAMPNSKLVLAHFNHGLRGKTAKRDENFVKGLAGQYQVPFKVGHVDKKKISKKHSIEEMARSQRYSFFQKTYKKRKYHALLSAHHADDQAETVLMRLCQGTGLRGLSAVREEMKLKSMKCIRPLLSFSKTEIKKFMKENSFKFCEDESNQSSQYLRNRIRSKVLPYLKKQINPQVIRSLAKIPEMVCEENKLINQLANEFQKQLLVRKSKKKTILKRSVFNGAHPALQFRVLDTLIKKMNPEGGVLFEHMSIIKQNLKKSVFSIDLRRGIKLSATKTTILIIHS